MAFFKTTGKGVVGYFLYNDEVKFFLQYHL
jgi:hypothetical protein